MQSAEAKGGRHSEKLLQGVGRRQGTRCRRLRSANTMIPGCSTVACDESCSHCCAGAPHDAVTPIIANAPMLHPHEAHAQRARLCRATTRTRATCRRSRAHCRRAYQDCLSSSAPCLRCSARSATSCRRRSECGSGRVCSCDNATQELTGASVLTCAQSRARLSWTRARIN